MNDANMNLVGNTPSDHLQRTEHFNGFLCYVLSPIKYVQYAR